MVLVLSSVGQGVRFPVSFIFQKIAIPKLSNVNKVIFHLGRKLPRPKMIVSLERHSGTARGEKIKIGSRINITCVVPFSNCAQLTWSWTKDYQLITENQTGYKQENGTNQCMRKLIIDKVTASSKGDYRCQAVVWREGFPPTDVYRLVSLIPGESGRIITFLLRRDFLTGFLR